jgi:hypothetical protein
MDEIKQTEVWGMVGIKQTEGKSKKTLMRATSKNTVFLMLD